MKKSVVVFSIVLILSIGFVSAGLFDWFNNLFDFGNGDDEVGDAI